MSDQRCGTCRWWEPRSGQDIRRVVDIDIGDCRAETPLNTPECMRRLTTIASGGENCPCYERKEANEREATD